MISIKKQVTKKIKIVVVDDHSLFREGLSSLLQTFESIDVVGEANNGNNLLELLKNITPDIILMDLNMPMLDGLKATEICKERYPHIKIIILSMFNEDEYILNLLKLNINGYLVKDTNASIVKETIHKVYENGVCFNERIQEILLNNQNKRFKAKLKPGVHFSERELEITQNICKGLTNKEIGSCLGLSHRTIEGYRRQLLKKTDSQNMIEFVIHAFKNGLVE